MDGNFSHCDFCDGNHECYDCPDVVIPEKLIDRLECMSDGEIAHGIYDSHPVTQESKISYDADALAMRLIHERHDKREIVNLIRWLLMGCPTPK